jgi:hypothetical protein
MMIQYQVKVPCSKYFLYKQNKDIKKNVIYNVSGIFFLGNGIFLLFNGKIAQIINTNSVLPWKIVLLRFEFHTRLLSCISLYD